MKLIGMLLEQILETLIVQSLIFPQSNILKYLIIQYLHSSHNVCIIPSVVTASAFKA